MNHLLFIFSGKLFNLIDDDRLLWCVSRIIAGLTRIARPMARLLIALAHLLTMTIAYRMKGGLSFLLSGFLPGIAEIYWIVRLFRTDLTYGVVYTVALGGMIAIAVILYGIDRIEITFSGHRRPSSLQRA